MSQPLARGGPDAVPNTGAGLISVLSTEAVPEAHRLDFWREVVCRTIAGIEAVALSGSRPYAGEIRTQTIPLSHLPSFDLLQVSADAQRVMRTPQLIDRTDGAWLLMIQEEGSCELGQGGRHARLAPGDIGFLDTSRPYEVLFPRRFRQRIVRMPESLFRDLLPKGRNAAGIVLPADGPLTAIARHNLVMLEQCARAIEPILLPAAAHCAMDHLALALRTAADHQPSGRRLRRPHGDPADHVARANAYMTDHLRDAKLSVGRVARAVDLSEGHLQEIYRAATGATVAEFIRDQRLAHCRRDLADPSQIDSSITSIAFRWGFSESSSFSRAFRRAFAMSPRRYRQLARGGR